MGLLPGIKKSVKEFGFFCIEGLAPFMAGKGFSSKHRAVNKVLVFAGGGLGDLIWVLPAITSLHKNYPHASITLLAAPSSSAVLELYPEQGIINEVISYEPRGRHRGLGAKLLLVRALRKKGFDLSYAPGRGEGMREEMVMNYLIGAPVRLGYKQGKTGLLNTCALEMSDNVPILRQNLEILRAAGFETTEESVNLEVPHKGIESAESFLKSWGIKRGAPFIVIHPGAAWNAHLKCWPLERYIELISALTRETGQHIVVIGSKGEMASGEALFRGLEGQDLAVNAIGKTSIREMAGIISLSGLFIGNDSGPLHLAQAFDVPAVAIFGYTSPKQIIWRKDRCVVIQPRDTGPLYLHQYDYSRDASDTAALESITVDEVMAGVRRAAAAMR